ncbi:hypothetical protein U9M48_029225 [Paspalum notatum var. saurae]|uniref:Uncharacterized protein n=1 Tax=Paspalum notatum var. saurae TaxID=547442 RepID=A0AAQ3TX53_PASNO
MASRYCVIFGSPDPACKELSTQEKPVIKESDDRLYPEQEDEGSLIKSVPASRDTDDIRTTVLEVIVPVGAVLLALFISSRRLLKYIVSAARF